MKLNQGIICEPGFSFLAIELHSEVQWAAACPWSQYGGEGDRDKVKCLSRGTYGTILSLTKIYVLHTPFSRGNSWYISLGPQVLVSGTATD